MKFFKRFIIVSLVLGMTMLMTSVSFAVVNGASNRSRIGFGNAMGGAGAATSVEQIKLPIVMYHNVLNSRKGKYVVSEKQLESDFKAFLDAGFTPVFMSEVIAWVDGYGTLPNKPLVITFDDGHYNNIHYALPIAKRIGVKFMICPVTSFSKFTVETGDHSNPNYSHITWEQMKESHKSGFVEYGNHTHNMHKFKPRFGIMRMSSECDLTYTTSLREDIEKSQEHFKQSGVPVPRTFAYPFGKYCKKSREVLVDMGFRALLTCDEWINTVKKGEPASLHKLGRFNRDGSMSSEELIRKIDKETQRNN